MCSRSTTALCVMTCIGHRQMLNTERMAGDASLDVEMPWCVCRDVYWGSSESQHGVHGLGPAAGGPIPSYPFLCLSIATSMCTCSYPCCRFSSRPMDRVVSTPCMIRGLLDPHGTDTLQPHILPVCAAHGRCRSTHATCPSAPQPTAQPAVRSR